MSLLMANFTGDDGSWSFSKNSFANNTGGGISQLPTILIQALSIRENNLEDKVQRNSWSAERRAVDATNNWWGTNRRR